MLLPIVLVALQGEIGLPIFTPEQTASHYVFVPGGEVKLPDPRVRWEAGGMTFLDAPTESGKQDFAYLITRYPVRNYRLSLEYEWGTKKFAPRENALRDSGLLYHVTDRDKVWPESVECQIQEGETGDVFLLAGGIKAESRFNEGQKYDPSGSVKALSGGMFRRSQTLDTLKGWNRVELVAKGADATYRVNGKENNVLSNLKWADGRPIDEGRIALQLEGAEIWYRNVRISPLSWPERHRAFRVLVFSKTKGFRHDSIPEGIAAVQNLGKSFGFEVETTEDAASFSAEKLKRFAAVVFLNTTGDVLDGAQQKAFEGYIRGGGGFVGVHSASDTEFDWPWYAKLVGAQFASHPEVQNATLRLKAESPSTSSLPRSWKKNDEWYNFRKPPEGVEILLDLDESSYKGGTMTNHPIAWQHEYEGGRAWYTGLGHTKESYADPLFLLHLLGGVQYAAKV